MSDLNVQVHLPEPEMKGWLFKWTNYIKGYQKRWFVLYNGLLSYYRTQAEMQHTCRGTISLHGAIIHTEDSCNFVISHGGIQTFHLKASTEVDRQRWVTAIELAKAKAIRMMESEDEEEIEDMVKRFDENEMQSFVKTLSEKLEDLSIRNDLIMKHGAALQHSLSELEQFESSSGDLAPKIKAVNEKAILFRITSNAMINACADYLELTQTQATNWHRMFQHEHEQRLHLEEMVEQLACQHSHLEQAAEEATSGQCIRGSNKTYSDGEEEFFDAEDQVTDYLGTTPSKSHRITANGVSTGNEGAGGMSDGISSSGSDGEYEGGVITDQESSGGVYHGRENEGLLNFTNHTSTELVNQRKRRKVIPVRPNYSLNLWSIMKNCIGKDLSEIPMPVNFSEPLSMLQRLTEVYEYSELLDKAAECEDNFEQMAYMAAFAVSPYATTCARTGKPFNPLLGETYECDRRDDLGWYAIAEQVSHHPPISAQHTIGKGWISWHECSISSKFRGKYLQVNPLGISHVLFEKSGNHYTCNKITTTVNNIIIGKLWIDQEGDMDIINHKTGDKCHLKYHPYSYFSREKCRKVTGVVADSEGNIQWVLTGTWDSKLEGAKVINTVQDEGNGRPHFEMSSPVILWRRRLPQPEYEKMYYFTQLAVELNEPEEHVAPTDSRNRPDQRYMEIGSWDEANKEKLRLEDKQRSRRRQREQEAERAAAKGCSYPGYEPVWFKKQIDPITGNPIHTFQGKYWECKETQDWSSCPNIF